MEDYNSTRLSPISIIYFDEGIAKGNQMKNNHSVIKKMHRLMSKFQSVIAKDNGLKFRNSDIKIGDKLYKIYAPQEDIYIDAIGSEFEPEMVCLFRSLIDKKFHCLDIGANIGLTSILFSELGAQVDSFEPSPTTFTALEKNIKTAGIKNVHLNNLGLGAKSMESELAYSPDNRSGGFIANQIKAQAGLVHEKIQIKRLDDLYIFPKNDKVDFIKIDVEGFEKSVLEGGTNLLTSNQPIVVLEVNHWCLNAFQRITIPDFFDFLRSIFPLLYAVNFNNTYADLHNEDDSYHVMYEHIIHFNFSNLVGAFDQGQLTNFKHLFRKI